MKKSVGYNINPSYVAKEHDKILHKSGFKTQRKQNGHAIGDYRTADLYLNTCICKTHFLKDASITI